MSNKLNFVFCFDKNYALQAQICIISLLDKVSEPINIFIIYSEVSFSNLSTKITKHTMLNNLKIFQFREKQSEFPNIANTHVSSATYYRFFISHYIDASNKYLIYMDTDIICVNDPVSPLKNEIQGLDKSDFTIGAVVEYDLQDDQELFNRLELNSSYFNAGVMIINYKNWCNLDIGNKLLDHMVEIKEKVKFWDQDVLNSLFNGSFLRISESLNYSTSVKPNYRENLHNIEKNINFLHFSGKIKPWHLKGTDSKVSELYHRNYRKLDYGRYHLINRGKKMDFKNLLFLILSLKIFHLDEVLNFLKQSFKLLSSNNQ